jgi:hypothetical protein
MSLEKHFEIVAPPSLDAMDPDYSGYVFVSDIDRTYLDTEIDSIGGLLRAAFEGPERKSNIPGFSTILRAIRRGPLESPQENPLFFVSASPPQMSAKILSKMSLDGVAHDGVVFKNQLRHVRSGNFKKLREQLSYKLSALLIMWRKLPKNCKIIFFGDDSESDALVFSLFAEIVAGVLKGRVLKDLLQYLGVQRKDAVAIAWGAKFIKEARFPVHAAFINLETGSQPSYYEKLGPFLFPTDNSLQVALSLVEFDLIRARAVVSVARDSVIHHDMSPAELASSLEEGAIRGLYSSDTLESFWPLLEKNGFLPPRKLIKSLEKHEGSVKQIKAWQFEAKPMHINQLKTKYSAEGRY